MIQVGVIGCGYWGPNLIRNLSKTRECKVIAVADADPAKLEEMKRLYPTLVTYSSGEELLEESSIQAVVIATPISSHYRLGKLGLSRGKHLLIEKPLTATVAQAEELISMAEAQSRVLMVDHTFLYSGAVKKIEEIMSSGQLGDLYYYDSVRVNLGLLQPDVNVLWDLAPHDFAIMLHLVNKEPQKVSAIGSSPVRWEGWERESIVYVAVQFSEDFIAHFHVNWLSPVKVRQTLIGGSKKMVIYDHLDQHTQVKVFDKGLSPPTEGQKYKALVHYRTGDMWAPKIDQAEPLELVCSHFIECIRNKRKPLTDGRSGLRVVRLLEAAQDSLSKRGLPVSIQG